MSLKHAILVLLETEPGSGYDLLKQFKSRLGYFWNAKHQQIYQQLKILSEQSLISAERHSQEGKPDKKIYQITDNGIAELRKWLSGPIPSPKVNDALLVKIYGGHLLETTELVNEISAHLEAHQDVLSRLLEIEASYQSLKEEEQKKYRLPYLTLRRGIIGEQAWIEWANEAINSLKK